MEFDAVLLPPAAPKASPRAGGIDRTINDELDACVGGLPGQARADRRAGRNRAK